MLDCPNCKDGEITFNYDYPSSGYWIEQTCECKISGSQNTSLLEQYLDEEGSREPKSYDDALGDKLEAQERQEAARRLK